MIRQCIRLCRGAVAVFLLGFTVLPAAAQTPPANPVLEHAADPHAAVFDERVYIYPTNGGDHFRAWSSADLRDWQAHGPTLHFNDVPWLEPGTRNAWAPAVHEHAGRFYFYFSVGGHPSRIGVAVGDQPTGPFVDSGQPLITDTTGEPAQQFEAIDPMVFRDLAGGATYLYAGGSRGATLRVWELNDDLTSLKRKINIEQPRMFTEGAFMHERGGVYHLSYSHGYWKSAGYSVHYSTADTPTGPWTYRGCILQSTADDPIAKGPGHHSFFVDPRTGETWIAYHRWEGREGAGPYKGHRSTALERVEYDDEGLIVPVVMTVKQ